MKTSIIVLCTILGGCATCRENKTACVIAIGTAVIAGSIIATERERHPYKIVVKVNE